MRDFFIEISSDGDKKVISLDVDEMDICIYQETGNGMVRIFEITCDRPGGKVIGTLLTKVEYVGDRDDTGAPLELLSELEVLEAYSNKHGG